MIRVLQIVPRVPPAVCGIGDYSWLLAQALRDGHDIHSSFLSAGTTWAQPTGDTEFPVFRLAELTADALVEFVTARAGEFQAIVLHMSSYGYQKRGVPLWLANGWRRLSQMKHHPRLITMFHELYASGPLRSSAFWLQPLQKWVLREVAFASDAVRTNREAYAAWLKVTLGLRVREIPVMPVFSNFGEPDQRTPFQQRNRSMVMFCSGIHGGQNADGAVRVATDLAQRFGMLELHVIGEKAPTGMVGEVKMIPHAFLPAPELSRLMLASRMAFTGYHPLYLAKSGVMAGYAAHGLAVVATASARELPDGLRAGKELLRLDDCMADEAPHQLGIELIGDTLQRWYAGHSLANTAASYQRQLQPEALPA